MRIDSHVHFCESSRFDDLEQYRSRLGLDKVILVSLPSKDINYNDAVRYAIKMDSEHYLGYGCLDYGREEFSSQVKELKIQGFSGLKLWIGKPSIEREMGYSLLSSEIGEAVDTCDELGFSLIVHIADPPTFWAKGGLYEKGYPGFQSYIDELDSFLIRHPQTRCIVAHLAFLAGGIHNLERLMDSHHQMYIDTAPGRWFYKEIGDSADEWRAFFHKYRYRICCGSDSMFFKNDDKLFPYRTLDDNIEVYQNMEKFFFGHGTILDPFPRKKQEEICSLGLDVNDERLIIGENMEKIFKKRAVVVGLGIGMAHVAAYLESKDAVLYGVSELNNVRLEKVGGTFSEGNMLCLKQLFSDSILEKKWEELEVKVFSSIDEVVADPMVDIVSICTPDYLHPEHLRKVMASGKDILLEKPLAINYDDARSLEPEIKSYKHDFAIAYEFRSIPPVIQLRELVESGELGEVKAFSLYHFRTPFKRDKWNHWIQKKACSGGLLVEETCHWFDLARYITGKEIDSVSCVTNGDINKDFDFEDIAYVNGTYSDGAIFQISHSLTGFDFSLQITVHGTKKVAWCNFKETKNSSLDAGQTDYYAVVSVGPVGGSVDDAQITTYALEATEPWAIKDQVMKFCHEVSHGLGHGAGLDDGMKSLEAALCAGEAARTGKAVKLGF